MVQILKFFYVSCMEFPKKIRFRVDIKFMVESVHLSSEGKEFHTVRAAKENERCQNVFIRILGIHKILLPEEERKFLLGVDTESK